MSKVGAGGTATGTALGTALGTTPAAIPGVRWQIPAVLLVTLFIGYLDRMNVSLALPLMAREFGWDANALQARGGQLLTLFYVGYGLANLFLSPLASRLGPRFSLSLIIVLWSLFTALGALASASFMALAATRILLGVAEGVHFPMMNLLTKRWFPPQERARANGMWMAGLLLAICLSPLLLVPLMHTLGWRPGFLVLAVTGLAISLPLVRWKVWDTPAVHPTLSAAERDYIETGNVTELITDTPPGASGSRGALWRALTQPMMLLVFAVGLLNNIVAMGIALWLPSYFVVAKGLPYEDLVYASSLPYVFGVLGMALWATLGDRGSMRAGLGMVGFIGAAISLWFALTAPDIRGAIAGFAVGVFFISAFAVCEFALVQRLMPPSVMGQGAGIYNGVTTLLGGGSAPLVVSGLIGGRVDGTPEGIYVVIATCLICALLMAVLARNLRY